MQQDGAVSMVLGEKTLNVAHSQENEVGGSRA
jgi:hypothetical protein